MLLDYLNESCNPNESGKHALHVVVVEFFSPCKRNFVIKFPSYPRVTESSLSIIALDLGSPAHSANKIPRKANV